MTRKYSPNHPAVRHRMANTPLPDTASVRERTAAVRARRGMRPAREHRTARVLTGVIALVASAATADRPALWATLLIVGACLILPVIERIRKEQGY